MKKLVALLLAVMMLSAMALAEARRLSRCCRRYRLWRRHCYHL